MTAKLNAFLIVRLLTITCIAFVVAAMLAPVAFGHPPDPG
jgi:hypothetical protein